MRDRDDRDLADKPTSREDGARSVDREPDLDCVVVGGGMAGLAAAWELRDLNTVLLEAEPRVGGRVKSERRGNYWLSVGAHMFGEPGSIIGRLVEEAGLETLRIHGDMLAISWGDHLYRGGRPEMYPIRLPLEWRARADLIRSGLKVRRAAARYESLSRRRPDDTAASVRRRLLSFLDDRSFADLVGPVHPQVDSLFRTTAHRMTAESEEVAAGCMAALFAHVWSSGEVVLGRNLRGGSAELPRALAQSLGPKVHLETQVHEVVAHNDHVLVRSSRHGEEVTLRARYAVVATPAYVTRRIISNLASPLLHALESIDYGPFVVAAILTNEASRMPWDDLYSVLTPGRSFTMFFNHANVLRAPGRRSPGGAVMVYAGAGKARALLDQPDEQITTTFLADLEKVFPEMHGIVEDVWVQRWERAQPFQKPGRSRFQELFESPINGRVYLAGDYTGDWAHMESAAETGREAAIGVRSRLRKPSSALAPDN